MSNFVNRLKPRKFILAVVAAVVAFANAYFELGMTTEQVWSIITPLLAFVGVEGAIDYGERKQTVIVENDYLNDEIEGV